MRTHALLVSLWVHTHTHALFKSQCMWTHTHSHTLSHTLTFPQVASVAGVVDCTLAPAQLVHTRASVHAEALVGTNIWWKTWHVTSYCIRKIFPAASVWLLSHLYHVPYFVDITPSGCRRVHAVLNDIINCATRAHLCDYELSLQTSLGLLTLLHCSIFQYDSIGLSAWSQFTDMMSDYLHCTALTNPQWRSQTPVDEPKQFLFTIQRPVSQQSTVSWTRQIIIHNH